MAAVLARIMVAGGAGYATVRAGAWDDSRIIQSQENYTERQLIKEKAPDVHQYLSSVSNIANIKESLYQSWNNGVSYTFVYLAGLNQSSVNTKSKVRNWIESFIKT